MTTNLKKHFASLLSLAIFSFMAFGSTVDEGTVVDKGLDPPYVDYRGTKTIGNGVEIPDATFSPAEYWIRVRNAQGDESRITLYKTEWESIKIGDYWKR